MRTLTNDYMRHEFSGVVEAVAADVDPNQIGSEVFGMNDWFADGATADYCTSASTSVAAKPSRLSHLEAASVPIGALTARWRPAGWLPRRLW
jgi:NADPH:quinone reductase-like Zn-dependent oxidoreductase